MKCMYIYFKNKKCWILHEPGRYSHSFFPFFWTASQDCVTLLLAVTTNKLLEIPHLLNLKVGEVKLLFSFVRVKNTRIQHRSPWLSRPSDPPAHGGIRSGLSFPPCLVLCGAHAWFLSPLWRCECGSQRADPDPQMQGPLSPSVVLADLPLSLFSVSGGKRFPLQGKEHEWWLCWFGEV